MHSAAGSVLLFICCSWIGATVGQSVAVFGGGIAGLTVAHELAIRGFQVTLYEKSSIFGGKAASFPFLQSGYDGRADLPSEHGFRFFPGFYQHIIDTMKSIPNGLNGSVVEALVSADYELLARANPTPTHYYIPTTRPRSLEEWIEDIIDVVKLREMGISLKEAFYLVQRFALLMYSCPARWSSQFDSFSYWDYMHADELSEAAVAWFVVGATRNLVAVKPQICSLKTIGECGLRMMFGDDSGQLDRLLDGPTNAVWINVWVEYLQKLGVTMMNNTSLQSLNYNPTTNTLSSATVQLPNGKIQQIELDYYVTALPIQVLEQIINQNNATIKRHSRSLANLHRLHTDWMNGVQYYLNQDMTMVKGHVNFLDSPWALTAVSQHQFWPNVDLSDYGDGKVKGIISVDISNWHAPGCPHGPSKGKAAANCTRQQIRDEVWYQMHLHFPDWFPLDQSFVETWTMDPNIHLSNGTLPASNSVPLLVNLVGSYEYRPGVASGIGNMLVAGDYVATNTDLACMESASEAAKRAVNALLADQHRHDFCTIHSLAWVNYLEPETTEDCILYGKGQMPIDWDLSPNSTFNSHLFTKYFHRLLK